MSMSKEALSVGLFEVGAVKFSNFEWKLKSGRQSPFYFNIRPLTSVNSDLEMSAEKQLAITDGFIDHYSASVDDLVVDYDHLHGIAQAGTVLGALVAYKRGDSYFWQRIGKKDHGIDVKFEGHQKQGDRIVTIDDVVTDGATKIEKAKELEDSGFTVAGQVIGMDRNEGGIENVAGAGYKVQAVLSLNGVAQVLRGSNMIGNQEIEWLQQYHEGLRADGVATTFEI